jgi:hypothetical protein
MRTLIARTAIVLVATLINLEVWAQAVTVMPASPRFQETVRLQVPEGVIARTPARVGALNGWLPHRTLITMTGNRINVSVELYENGFGFFPGTALDIPIGQFPAGIYDVELSRRLADGAFAGVVGTARFTVPQRLLTQPLGNYSDIWWNPTESGWGMSIIQHGTGPIFATWFVYGAEGRPTWYVVTGGEWFSESEFRGQLYRTTGPQFLLCSPGTNCNPAFNPSAVNMQLVGQAQFGFHSDNSTAFVNFTIDGLLFQKTLERLRF